MVIANDYFFDHDLNRSRSVDLTTFAFDVTTTEGDLDLRYMPATVVIECKKSDNHIWAFFYANTFVDISESSQLIDYKRMLGKNSTDCCLWDAKKDLSFHYGRENRWQDLAISYSSPKKGSENPKENEGKDEIFEAINQVLKCISFKASEEIHYITGKPGTDRRWYPVIVYYPVIVFDGLLCRVSLAAGKVVLTEADHVVLKTLFKPQHYERQQEFYIDVVTKKYFEKYLEELEKECRELVGLVYQNTASFLTDARMIYQTDRVQSSKK